MEEEKKITFGECTSYSNRKGNPNCKESKQYKIPWMMPMISIQWTKNCNKTNY